MRGRTSNIKIELTPESRDVLQSLLRPQKIPAGLAKRARAILLLADGQTFSKTCLQVGMGERHLRKWVVSQTLFSDKQSGAISLP